MQPAGDRVMRALFRVCPERMRHLHASMPVQTRLSTKKWRQAHIRVDRALGEQEQCRAVSVPYSF